MDREGLRVVPEAVLDVEGDNAAPAEHAAGTATAPGDHARAADGRGTFRALRSRPFRLAFGALLAATAGAPDVALACLTLLATGAAAFSFVTLCSTTLQLHSSPAYRGRIMALWIYVYIGTTPVGSIITGAIISAAGTRAALLAGAAACLAAAAIAARVRTPPHADAPLTDLASA